MDKVAVFVDLGYLNKITSNFGNLVVSFEKLQKVLIDETTEQHYRTYVYFCLPYQSNPPTDDEKLRVSQNDRFIRRIKKIPHLEFRAGRLSKKGISFVQKRIDTYFAIDLVKLSLQKTIQKAILIAGDSDFVPAIKEGKENGVIIQLLYYPKTVHGELLECCDERKEITPEFLQSVKKS